jgi:hypothetical protein
MIGQYLLNNNENATVAFCQKIWHPNGALVSNKFKQAPRRFTNYNGGSSVQLLTTKQDKMNLQIISLVNFT